MASRTTTRPQTAATTDVPPIVFDDVPRLLVLLHALAAIVLVGAATHQAVIAVGYVRGNLRLRLGRLYAVVVAISYAVTFAIGLAAYPAFRYRTRALYLDRHEPWASNLFDMKENFAALGLPLVVAVLVLSRVLGRANDRRLVGPYLAFVLVLAAIVWFSVISGLLVTMAKGA